MLYHMGLGCYDYHHASLELAIDLRYSPSLSDIISVHKGTSGQCNLTCVDYVRV